MANHIDNRAVIQLASYLQDLSICLASARWREQSHRPPDSCVVKYVTFRFAYVQYFTVSKTIQPYGTEAYVQVEFPRNPDKAIGIEIYNFPLICHPYVLHTKHSLV